MSNRNALFEGVVTKTNRLPVENTITGQQNTNRHVWVSPTNALDVNTTVRLVGTNFDGTTKDANFWTETTTNGGTVTQSGEIEMNTSTGVNGTASYKSVRRARFVVGAALHLIGAFKFVTAGTTDNVRRCGAYNTTDGFFFQLDGTTFSVGSRKSSSDTLVSSGSFNGNLGSTFTPLTTKYYKLDIEWTPIGTFWYVDGVLLHKNGSGHISNILTLPITFENINDNGNTTDVVFDCLGVVILRQGELQTNPTSYYYEGSTTTGTNLKIGAGSVHGIIFGGASNNANIALVDSTTASTPVLYKYLASGALSVPVSLNLNGLPFSDGLRLVISAGTSIKMTIVYE